MAARNLSFLTTADQGVSDNTVLLLTFKVVDQSTLYKDQFPVVWKALKFSANQIQTANVFYSARLGIAAASAGNDIVIPESFVEIGLGQSTTLSQDSDDFVSWSEPTPKPPPGHGDFLAWNKSGVRHDFCIGTLDQSGNLQPALYWDRVANGESVHAQFTPKLRIYAYKRYKETQVLRAELESALLGEWDLAKLNSAPYNNSFHVYEDNNNGGILTIVGSLDAVARTFTP